MGLKCSMFGHSYGDPEVEREREEDGDEVVVTVREIKVCSRCGAESVVSENKEVTTLREPPSADESAAPDDAPEPIDAADDEPSEPDAPADGPPTPDVDADPEDEGAELIGEDDPVFGEGDGSADDAAAPDADPDDRATPSETTSDGRAVDDEDAAIIDAESGTPAASDAADGSETPDEGVSDGRAGSEATREERSEDGDGDDEDPPVADPEDLLPEEATADDGESETPDERSEEGVSDGRAGSEATREERSERGVSDDRAGSEAAHDEDDGVILDEEPPAPDRDHGEWPDSEDVGPPATDAETEDWPDDPGSPDAAEAGGAETGATEANAGVVDTGIESAGRAPSPDSAPSEETGAELFCPSCNYTAALDRASLRVGDICPECKRGYLSER